jgi:cytoskeletal protein RodZ
MMDIGSQLRAAREDQGLTLEQVFKGTRIKTSFLEAIEANQFNALPGAVQARGFVRSYANYLGLDGELLASALDADKMAASDVRPLSVASTAIKPGMTPPPAKLIVQPPPKPPIQTQPKPPLAAKPSTPLPGKQEEPGKRSLKLPSLALNSSKLSSSAKPSGGLPTWALIVGAVILFMLGVLLVISALGSNGQTPAPGEAQNVPNTSGGLLPADRPEVALTADGPVSITLYPGEHVWARITLDGQTAFEGMLEPGAAQNWEAADQIIVETGNGAALTVLHQGQESVLGERGQIVARAWGHEGAVDVPLAVPEVTPQVTAALTNTVQ